jgi:predicted transcriptional regulator
LRLFVFLAIFDCFMLYLWYGVFGKRSMADKKTMTVNLSDAEMHALEEICEQKDLSKTAVVRQALRLYQLVNARIASGGKLFIEDEKKEKAELMVI